jgi:hypothetical protein
MADSGAHTSGTPTQKRLTERACEVTQTKKSGQRGRFGATAAGAVVALVALPLGAAPAGAIGQGTAISVAPPWAAYVTTVSKFLWTQTRESSCTGTIVGDGWILTAAHCVMKEDNKGRPTATLIDQSKFEIVLNRNDLTKTKQGGQWEVDRVVVAPGWNPSTITGDAALLRLKTALPATARPMPIAPAGYTLADGQAVVAYGYGDTSETYTKSDIAKGDYSKYIGDTSNVLRATQGASYTQVTNCTTEADWCMKRNGPSSILHGDSGGPWVPDTANPFTLGITSYDADPQKTSPTTIEWSLHAATRLTTSSIHDWIARTAGIITPVVGTIYRNPATGASWLAESDGFLHPIPDGGTYLCLTGNGSPVSNGSAFTLAELPKAAANATCSNRGSVLLYGDGDSGEDSTGFDNLRVALTASGFTVTALPGQTSLPSGLSSYDEVWHYGIDVPTTDDQQALISYAKSGKGVFLTGERPCCEQENQADAAILNSLVVTVGGIGVGNLGDIGDCSDKESVNQQAVGNIATYPNRLTTWHPQCPGGLSNIASRNVFASSASGAPVAAVWGSDDVIGGGKVVLLMDVNWAQTTYQDPGTFSQIAQNIGAFLH